MPHHFTEQSAWKGSLCGTAKTTADVERRRRRDKSANIILNVTMLNY
jgi:hypothetical protein